MLGEKARPEGLFKVLSHQKLNNEGYIVTTPKEIKKNIGVIIGSPHLNIYFCNVYFCPASSNRNTF